MSSDWGDTLGHTLVAEPYSSDQVQTGALQAALYSRNRMPRAGRLARTARWRHEGRETHRHDYTRPPAALGDELGGLSSSLGLSVSPPLILSSFDRISRGLGVEEHEHVDCNAVPIRAKMPGASAKPALHAT